jgi:hypothetical protein
METTVISKRRAALYVVLLVAAWLIACVATVGTVTGSAA